MSLSPPSPPDPYQEAAAQTQTNEASAQYQANINNVNQTNPYGTLSYNQTGTAADGAPQYTATTQLNPAEQNLFNTAVNTQQGIGTAANQLISNLGSSLTKAPNLSTGPLTSQMMNWFGQYEQPIWNQQQSNLNSQLASQGVTAGSEAYNNAQNLQARNVGDATNQFLMQAEPQAYNQALQSYEAPIQTLGTLLGESQPGSVGSALAPTNQENVAPANISQDIQSSYQSQLGNYENTMQGLFSIPSAVMGGWAMGGFKPPSDRRIKENIVKVGVLDNGLPVYIFNFKADPNKIQQIGLMAQDVEKVIPSAVIEINGIKHVDYEKAVK